MKQIVLAVMAAVFLVSCQNMLDNEGQKNLELNEQAIQNYITSKKLTMEKSPSGSGLYYTYLKSNSGGTKPKVGDEVAIHYTLFTLQDVKFDSTERVANKPLTYIYGVNSLIAGMDEAMSIMRTGDRMLLLMNHFLAFGSQSDNILPAYSAIGADLELMSVRTEDQRIEDYITTKQLTVTELSSTGLRFIRTATTTENKVAAGEVVKVKYTGKLLNDKQFDSGEIQVRVGGGGVIKGFDEGVSKMRYNEKAILVFPSSLGYGTQGSGTTIMPYAPLVFEVEVVK